MTPNEAIQRSLDAGKLVCMMYLDDLTDEEMLVRPHAEMNHINFQVGHLILEENHMMNGIRPGSMPELPSGFAEKYSASNKSNDSLSDFFCKAELLATMEQQREATLIALHQEPPERFHEKTGVDYAPTIGCMYSMQGSHWLMHCGQWAVVRRKIGRPPLF